MATERIRTVVRLLPDTREQLEQEAISLGISVNALIATKLDRLRKEKEDD